MNERLRDILIGSKRFLIIASYADEDSLSSAVVLGKILNSEDTSADVIHFLPVSRHYQFIPFFDSIIALDPADVDYGKYDTVITVDAASLKQIMDVRKAPTFAFPENIKTISIDHHKGNTPFATFNFNDFEASSTAELIYLYFIGLTDSPSYTLSKDEATALLIGIMGDTGFLRWNMSARVLEVCKKLLEAGAEHFYVTNYLYYNRDKRLHEFLKEAIGKIEFFDDIRFMLLTLNFADIQRMGIAKEDMHIFTRPYHEMFTDIYEGYDCGGILIEEGERRVMGSLRGNPYANKINLAELCKSMSEHGGGHPNSAGFVLCDNSVEYVKDMLITKLRNIQVERKAKDGT